MPNQHRTHAQHQTTQTQTQTKHSPEQQAPVADEVEDPIVYLQRTIGNQATIQLLRDPAMSNLLQRDDKPLTKEQIKARIKQGNERRKLEKSAKNSWSGWVASWIPGTATNDAVNKRGRFDPSQADKKKDEEEDEEVGGTTVSESDESFSAAEVEGEGGTLKKEEDSGVKNPFKIEEIEIDLGEMKGEKKGTSLGDVKGEGKRSITGDGKSKYSGKASAEGSKGKAEAEGALTISAEELEGEGKVSMLLGGSNEVKTGNLDWGIGQQQIRGSGSLETKVGLSADVAGKLNYKTGGDIAGEGKLGAFLGASSEGKVNVKFTSNGKPLGAVEGKVGISYGVGGELDGRIKWEGGVFEFGWNGKLSAGVGFSYGYSLKFDTNAAAQSLTGWLPTVKYYMWDIWELPDDMDDDDIFIIF